MSNLIVSFDPGASLTKIVYELATEGKPHLMTMEPEMLKLPQSSIDAYMSSRKGLESPKPADEAWVSSPADGDTQCTVVGFLARQFSASARLDKLKYETSIHKALAVIGAIAQHNKLPNRFSLSLTSLLPYGEYQNRQVFEQQLQSALKDFRFRGQRLRVKLERFECLPEGAGLAMIRQRQNGKEWFKAQTIAVLMFGHRNTSLLLFERDILDANQINFSAARDYGELGVLGKQRLHNFLKRTSEEIEKAKIWNPPAASITSPIEKVDDANGKVATKK